MKTILGKKMGMTQIFDEEGNVIPVTVIEAGPAVVTQVKTVETDGYNAVQIGFEEQKPQRVNKPLTGHFEKAGVTPKKHLAEFRTEEGETYEVGQAITVADFEVGKKLDVTGTSKGKGTQGNIKRHIRDLPVRLLQVRILPEYSRVMLVREEWAETLLQFKTLYW